MPNITVATCAFSGSHDVADNLARHLQIIDEAAALGVSLLVFPEISLHGYPRDSLHVSAEKLRDTWRVAERVPDGASVLAIAARAGKRRMHVIYGLNERGNEAGVVYNTAILTGPGGHIGSYRKVHVSPIEQFMWRKGNDWPVFETAIGRIGLLICNDQSWPESTRELTLRGAELLVMPTAWMFAGGEASIDDVWADAYRVYGRARAMENARWFISSNYAGQFGGGVFLGESQIIDPLGRVVADSGTLPGLALAQVDIRAGIEEAQAAYFGPRMVRDRRLETYDVLAGRRPPETEG